ncbi:hypothetical protein C8Q72DRAFT_891310 [Fomitopsis betulina]|nr:hypothetical protein C8Q72DRAFT_891310 [Fomitopsis betulina]
MSIFNFHCLQYIMATPDLTAEQLQELVLALSGKVHAALAASSHERGRAEAQLTDELKKYMPVFEKYARLKQLSMPRILASTLNLYFALGQVRLDHLNDPTIKRVISAMFYNEDLDYSVHAAAAALWWKRPHASELATTPRPAPQPMTPRTSPPMQPSLTQRKAGDDAGSSGAAKKTKTATSPTKKVVLTMKVTPSPLPRHNRAHKSAETVDDSGDDAVSRNTPPYQCNVCTNRKERCDVCTLIVRSLSNGALRKGPATEKSAMAFCSFTCGLVAKGLPAPDLAIWDNLRNEFIADLDSMDGQQQGTHPGLLSWIEERQATKKAGHVLPQYNGDKTTAKKEPRRMNETRTSKGKGRAKGREDEEDDNRAKEDTMRAADQGVVSNNETQDTMKAVGQGVASNNEMRVAAEDKAAEEDTETAAGQGSHPLPAPVRSNPAAQPRSLAECLSEPAPRPLPDFKKKSTEEVVGILEKKVSATIEHYQVIFDKKYLFESLLGDSRCALHHFADQLNWVSDNFDKANQWSKQQRDSISWACRCVGTVEFSTPQEPLVKRCRKVTKYLTSIANGGYLDWISL